MSQHLPAETETKSVVSAVATGLRQEAELGDAGIQIEKATLGRNKQHPIEEALRSSEHERDTDEETHAGGGSGSARPGGGSRP